MATPFRSDDEIRAMAIEQAGAHGEPRCRFVTGVLPLAGMTDVEAADLFFPADPHDVAVAMAKGMSTCGLTTEVGWRFANVLADVLYKSYQARLKKSEFAVTMEKVIAGENDTWVSAIPWVEGTPLPDVGDAPIIGCKSCGEAWARNVTNLEHEYTVVANDPKGGGLHHSVDGGQPGIAFRSRCWIEVWTGTNAAGQRTGELWAGTCNAQGEPQIAYDGRPVSGRRAIGYTRVTGLPLGPSNGPCVGGSALAQVAKKSGKILAVAAVAASVAWLLAQVATRPRGR